MSQRLPSQLPLYDRTLLRAVRRLVPALEREEWSRAWQAEIWHVRRLRTRFGVTADLTIGLACDALWLRTDSWQRTFRGTVALCLGSLTVIGLLSMVVALALVGSWESLRLYLAGPLVRSLFATPLVIFVGFATASRGHSEEKSTNKTLYWIRRQVFFALKMSLVVLIAFLMSADVCQPIQKTLPATAELTQVFFFVQLLLLGLRWAFRDQEQRCKQCLQSLANPERVGRPSHNLLEWNGTELLCKRGHGLLSVPEMETSWCESSRWTDLNPVWD